MNLPSKCPVCLKDNCDRISSEFDEDNLIVDEYFLCTNCDSEWKVPFVMVEKIVVWAGTIPEISIDSE